VVVGLATFVSYLVAYPGDAASAAERTQASTAALVTLLVGALWVLCVVARPLQGWRLALVACSALAYVLIFSIPVAQRLFLLDPTDLPAMATALGIGVLAAGAIEALWWVQGARVGEPRRFWRRPQD
ncbi:MAG TPA: hypothetical protein VGC57_06720, partial [Cellulomonas sp.]